MKCTVRYLTAPLHSLKRIATSPIARIQRARRLVITLYVRITIPMRCRYSQPTVSNNYGPYHFPEKLIPLCILNALAGKPLPIYGDGRQIRDWLYVKDHCCAIRVVLERGRVGETYNIGGRNELTNLEVVRPALRYP